MKKIIALVVVLVLLLTAICGCSNNDNKKVESGSSSANTVVSDTQSSEEITSSDETSSDGDSNTEETPVANSGTSSDTFIDTTTPTGTTSKYDTTFKEELAEEEEEETLAKRLRAGVCFDSGWAAGNGSDIKNPTKPAYDRSYYEIIARAGFDHVRIPFALEPSVISDGPEYLLDAEAMRYIDIAINHALDCGLVAILDNHHPDYNAHDNVPMLKRIWEQVAERYRYYPDELMFELVSEPSRDTMPDADLYQAQIDCLRIIRKFSPTRTVILTPNQWNEYYELWRVTLPYELDENGRIIYDDNGKAVVDKNILMAIHHYDPQLFTHQSMGNRPSDVHINQAIKDEITAVMEFCADYERRTGVQVWLGENGIINQGHPTECFEKCIGGWFKHFTSEAARLDLSYAMWEIGSGFSLMDNTTKEFKSAIINNMVLDW